jgi:hypothetical protein
VSASRVLEGLLDVGNGRIPHAGTDWHPPTRAKPQHLTIRMTVKMIEVYTDESGKLKDGHFLCFSAAIADSEAWQTFSEKWVGLLRRDKRTYIHMRELTKLGDDEVDRQLTDYRQVIRENLQAVACVGLDLDYYRTMDKWKRELLGHRKPMLFCFSRLMRLVMNKIQEWENQQGEQYPRGSGSLIFDDDEEYSVQCYRLYTEVRKEKPEVKRLFSVFSAADDEIVPGLQAADVLAWYQNRDLRRRLAANQPLGTSDPSTQPQTFKSELYDGPGLENAVLEIIEALPKRN